MPQPTPRLLALLLLAALPYAAADRWPYLVWLAAGWLGVLTLLLAVDAWATPGKDAWEVTRQHDERLSVAAWNPVALHIRLRHGGRALRVWVRDVVPEGFGIAEADRVQTARVVPRTTHTLDYAVRPLRRGRFAWGDLHLRWESVFGLFRRQAAYPAAETVKVYPNLVDVRKYDLLMRRNRLWEIGLRRTRVRGAGSEFERLRDYQPDDDFRRIHWPATARRGRPISIEYETERSQNLVAVLDVGRVMRSPVGDVAKMDFAINAVLLLAYVATGKGDRVGLLTFADTVQSWLAPRGGKGQFLHMLETLYAVEGAPVEPDYDAAFGHLGRQKTRRSLVLVFTDLAGGTTDPLVRGLMRLRRTHLPLLITIADPTVTALARQPITDSESLYDRTVAENLLEERRLTLDRLRHFGIHTLDVSAERLSVAVINRYLALRQV